MKECVFCSDAEIDAREIIRTELARAFPANIPIVPGHTLVCPVRHVERFSDLSEGERDAVFALAENIKTALSSLYGAEGFHEAWNEGSVAGQYVPHFHLHVVPRKKGDEGIMEYEPRTFLYRPGSRQVTPHDELCSVSDDIKKVLRL